MDIAVNLVESYLRLTGYLTLSEFEVQRRDDQGHYKTITDVDIMAIRFPGAVVVGDPHTAAELESVIIEDPALQLVEDCVDIIIGEVKQGPAELNPAIKDHGVLHSMLRRVEWLYESPLNEVIQGLQTKLVHIGASRGEGTIRTRIVAFGRSDVDNMTTMSLAHIVNTLLDVFSELEEAFRPTQFKEPAPAFLRLLLKSGFDVTK